VAQVLKTLLRHAHAERAGFPSKISGRPNGYWKQQNRKSASETKKIQTGNGKA
jgi:hypothetical protein